MILVALLHNSHFFMLFFLILSLYHFEGELLMSTLTYINKLKRNKCYHMKNELLRKLNFKWQAWPKLRGFRQFHTWLLWFFAGSKSTILIFFSFNFKRFNKVILMLYNMEKRTALLFAFIAWTRQIFWQYLPLSRLAALQFGRNIFNIS